MGEKEGGGCWDAANELKGNVEWGERTEEEESVPEVHEGQYSDVCEAVGYISRGLDVITVRD